MPPGPNWRSALGVETECAIWCSMTCDFLVAINDEHFVLIRCTAVNWLARIAGIVKERPQSNLDREVHRALIYLIGAVEHDLTIDRYSDCNRPRGTSL